MSSFLLKFLLESFSMFSTVLSVGDVKRLTPQPLPQSSGSPLGFLLCAGGGGGGWVGGLVANQKLSWTSLVVQWLRCLPTHAGVQSLVRELDPTCGN